MVGLSIKEIALEIGVGLISEVDEGNVRAADVHKILYRLSEAFSQRIPVANLAGIIGANPDLLTIQVPFDAVDGSYEKSMRQSLTWALVKECYGYRAAAEASVVNGRVIDTLMEFSDRLRQKAEQGAMPAQGIEEITTFVDRVEQICSLDEVDTIILRSLVGQMGSYATRIATRNAAALGLRPDQVHDPVLDAVQDLAFLATSSPEVLINEMTDELRTRGETRSLVR